MLHPVAYGPVERCWAIGSEPVHMPPLQYQALTWHRADDAASAQSVCEVGVSHPTASQLAPELTTIITAAAGGGGAVGLREATAAASSAAPTPETSSGCEMPTMTPKAPASKSSCTARPAQLYAMDPALSRSVDCFAGLPSGRGGAAGALPCKSSNAWASSSGARGLPGDHIKFPPPGSPGDSGTRGLYVMSGMTPRVGVHGPAESPLGVSAELPEEPAGLSGT